MTMAAEQILKDLFVRTETYKRKNDKTEIPCKVPALQGIYSDHL